VEKVQNSDFFMHNPYIYKGFIGQKPEMALSYTQETGQRQKDSAPIDIPVRYLNADL
jgi:hypothetical protein